MYVIGHVPVGYLPFTRNITAIRERHNEKLLAIFRKYSDVIAGHFYGHTHRDSIMVLLDQQGEECVVVSGQFNLVCAVYVVLISLFVLQENQWILFLCHRLSHPSNTSRSPIPTTRHSACTSTTAEITLCWWETPLHAQITFIQYLNLEVNAPLTKVLRSQVWMWMLKIFYFVHYAVETLPDFKMPVLCLQLLFQTWKFVVESWWEQKMASSLKEGRNSSWRLITLSISRQKPSKGLKRLFLSLATSPEGRLAVLSESDGSQPATKVRLEAGIRHDGGVWTGWPAASQPPEAGPELLAAAGNDLPAVLHPLHGQLQQQRRLWGRLSARPGVCGAVPGPALVLQVCRAARTVERTEPWWAVMSLAA